MRCTVTSGLLAALVCVTLTGCGALGGAPAASSDPAPAATDPAPAATPAAAPIVGLVGGTTLVGLRTDDPTLRDSRPVTGLQGDNRLVGIDYRVQDGLLYGVGNAGGIYTIEQSGAATKVRQLMVDLDGQNFGIDFNPAANALRIISDTGQNLRQPFAEPNARTAEDKALTNPAAPPAIGTVAARGAVAAGYTNNDTDNATASALFVLDTTADRVSIQSPANAGTLAPMGGLGVDAAPAAGFDVHATAGALATLQVGGSYGLYRIDLLTGKATSLGALDQDVTAIAVPLDVLTRDVVDDHAARRVIGGRPPRAEWARRVL